jgi:ankyrin repeat protein
MLKSPLGSHQTVCCFFCDDKIESQRDGKAILRSLIFQIITSRRKLIRYVKSAYDIQGPHVVENFNELWRIFTAIASDKRVGPIIVIVDAIDECEESTRSRFLESVSALISKAQSTTNLGPPRIKFLVTSRPLLGRRYTANLLEIEDVHKDDLRLVIQIKVGEIARRTKCKPETRSYLEQALYSKADQTFLWVTLVLNILERSYLASQKDFRRIIDNLPQGLVATYEGFLYDIPAEYQELAAKLLHFIVGSRRPLSLEELQILLALQDDHQTLAAVEEDYQPNIRDTVEGILGPLVRISGSQVNLVHQSLKEYLYDLSSQKENPLSTIYGTSPHKVDMLLTSTCMSYLHLDEFKMDLFSENESGARDSPVSLCTQSPQVDDNDSFLGPFALADDQILRDPEIVEYEACQSIIEKYKLYDYSAMYWARHFSSCSEICSERLRTSALALSEARDCTGLSWLRYYWFHAGFGLEFPLNFNSFVIACFFGHMASIDALLKNEPRIDQDTVGCGVYWAARMGHQGVVGRLLQHGVLPNSKIVHGHTPLAAAAQFGHLQVVELLLAEDGTDVNCTNHVGRTPISIAAGNGHAEVVARLLCHKGVDPDNSDSDGWTPLFWAVGGKHLDIVRVLAANKKVDVNHVDKRGRNALSWAAAAGENELVKYLLTYNDLDVQRKDVKGRTALSWAAANGHLEAISTLRQSKRISMSDKDKEGRNAISWACSKGHHLLLTYLIEHDRGGVDEEDSNGWTPLAWALDRNDPKTVEVLLASGLVNVNRKDRSGRSPLYWAAVYGYVDIVRMLINAEGVETDATDSIGRTPLTIAHAYGHAEVIGVLEGLKT